MLEDHPNHFSQNEAKRRQETKDLVQVLKSNPILAEEILHRRIAAERRRIWNRAINTLLAYAPPVRPEEPHPRQMESCAEYDTRRQEYFRQLDAFHHAEGYRDILIQRRELEEPPIQAGPIV